MRNNNELPKNINLRASRLARKVADELGMDGVEPMVDARMIAEDLGKLETVVEDIIGASHDLKLDVSELEEKMNEVLEFLRKNYELHKEILNRIDGK